MHSQSGLAILVAGLGFGDEGKGATVDFLVRQHQAKAVVRYNGGAQAAHNVVTADGRHHMFAQFGSGTFVPGVQTFLSRFMVINPFSMIRELRHLESLGINDAVSRLSIDGQALVTTPYHIAANRLREWLRGKNRHGSCGLGVGETLQDFRDFGQYAIFAADLAKPKLLSKKMEALRRRKLDSFSRDAEQLAQGTVAEKYFQMLSEPTSSTTMLARYQDFSEHVKIVSSDKINELLENGIVIFEGAQGVLLDHTRGFRPYVTKTDTTFHNAQVLLNEAGFRGERKKVGVLRAYATRHGAGPLVTEEDTLAELLPESHNEFGPWQGSFRIGYFDAPATRYALEVIGGVDELHLTCCDRLDKLPALKICSQHTNQNKPIYETQGGITEYIQTISGLVNVPITSFAFGPTAEQRSPELPALLQKTA